MYVHVELSTILRNIITYSVGGIGNRLDDQLQLLLLDFQILLGVQALRNRYPGRTHAAPNRDYPRNGSRYPDKFHGRIPASNTGAKKTYIRLTGSPPPIFMANKNAMRHVRQTF
jgi:hypothetical protein